MELSKEKLDSAYEAVELAKKTGKIKKGTNEVTKAIERGVAKLVLYAKDVNPPEVIMHIAPLCKEKGIICLEIPNKDDLGAAAGLSVSTSSVAIIKEGESKKIIDSFAKDETKSKNPTEESTTSE